MYRELMSMKLPINSQCPICENRSHLQRDARTETALVICPTCGKFRLSFEVEILLENLRAKPANQLYKISHLTRTMAERGFGKRDNAFFPVYSSKDLEQPLQAADPPVEEKLQTLLGYLGSISGFPGQTVDFSLQNDFSVVAARNEIEALFYLQTLEAQGLLSIEGQPLSGGRPCKVTAKGWLEIQRVAQSGAESHNGFIAMWFDPSRSAVDLAICEAISGAGYNPVRMDRLEHLNRIDDEIIVRIRQSKFLVADFTGHRNGVYFEAGFMLGLGRPVIWVCEKNELNDLHFDTRQYNMIDYSDIADLGTRLKLRIEANLGRGPVPLFPESRS